MKLLLVVAYIAIIAAVDAATLTNEQRLKVGQYISQCKQQENISDDQIARLRAGDFNNVGNDVKCFGNCFLEQVGVLRNGVLQEGAAVETFNPIVGEQKVRQALGLCRGEIGANKCETAFKLLTCLKDNQAILV